MDNQLQQKFQSLGFFRIFKEAFKTIFSAKKIFSLITLFMIFPLSLLMFSHLHILQFLIKRVVYYSYTPSAGNSEHHSLVVLWTIFSISNAAFLVNVFILYLLSTSSVVYTLVNIYAGNKALAFRELLSVVVKVSKKFMIGRIWWMLFYQIFTLSFLNCMCFWNLKERPGRWFSIAIDLILMLYAVNVVLYGCLSFDWHLACVFSIFDDSSNSTDLGKDKICTLTKSKWRFAYTIVAVIQLSAVMILVSFNLLVLRGNSPGFITISKVSYWIIFTLLLSVTNLLGFVIKTLIYFVCKADLGESNIDNLCLLVVLRLQEEFVAEEDATRTTFHKLVVP